MQTRVTAVEGRQNWQNYARRNTPIPRPLRPKPKEEMDKKDEEQTLTTPEPKALPEAKDQAERNALDRHAAMYWSACFDTSCRAHRDREFTPKMSRRAFCGRDWSECTKDNCEVHVGKKNYHKWYPQFTIQLCEHMEADNCRKDDCMRHLAKKREMRKFPGNPKDQIKLSSQLFDKCGQDLWMLCFAPTCKTYM